LIKNQHLNFFFSEDLKTAKQKSAFIFFCMRLNVSLCTIQEKASKNTIASFALFKYLNREYTEKEFKQLIKANIFKINKECIMTCSDYRPYKILIPRLTNSAVKGDH
jgi:hypothetical protein